MQVILLHLFLFTTTFSCGFTQKDDNRLDTKMLPSADENPAPNPDDGDNASVNVEEILRELSAEREKNRDLNQTISDMLDRMKDMEKNIMRNEEKITENQSSVVLLTRDVEDLQEGLMEFRMMLLPCRVMLSLSLRMSRRTLLTSLKCSRMWLQSRLTSSP